MTVVHPLLDQTRELLAAPLAGCSAEQLSHHPDDDPTRWSARQVIEHLSASWRSTSNGIEDRLQKGRPLRTRPTFKQRFSQLAVCECGFFPKGRQAPPSVQPGEIDGEPFRGEELIASFSTTLADMDVLLNRIEVQWKNAPVLTHFVLGPLNVRQWRRFHRTHAQHHVQQIENAIRSA